VRALPAAAALLLLLSSCKSSSQGDGAGPSVTAPIIANQLRKELPEARSKLAAGGDVRPTCIALSQEAAELRKDPSPDSASVASEVTRFCAVDVEVAGAERVLGKASGQGPAVLGAACAQAKAAAAGIANAGFADDAKARELGSMVRTTCPAAAGSAP
jgi:hypothetical protein